MKVNRTVLAAVCLIVCGSGSAIGQVISTETMPASQQAPEPLFTEQEHATARQALMSSLIDPDSARISHVVFNRVGNAAVFCGAVNAKNRVGGYVGDQPFVVVGDDVTLYQGKPGTWATFQQYWTMLCLRSPRRVQDF